MAIVGYFLALVAFALASQGGKCVEFGPGITPVCTEVAMRYVFGIVGLSLAVGSTYLLVSKRKSIQ